MQLKSYKYRIYPNKKQQEMLNKHFGCARFVYNWALETKQKIYKEENKSISYFDLNNKLKSELKKENGWLSEVNSQSLQQAVKNCDTAFKNFFRTKKGFPKFKNKKSKQSFQCPQRCIVNFSGQLISIPKIRDIRAVFHRKFNGKIKTVTISKNNLNQFFASILVESCTYDSPLKESTLEGTIGIDTGIKSLATCSNGEVFESKRFAKSQKRKLKLKQRRLSKKKKDSRKYKKYKYQIAKLSLHISNQRNDYLDKITHKLVNENQINTICVENLKSNFMIKNHNLAYDAIDNSICSFYTKLKYKCKEQGINYVEIDKFYPSSKTCSNCGYIKKDLKLNDRKWICPVCGEHHDRDYNASVNIKNVGYQALRVERTKVKSAECPTMDDRCISNLKSSDIMKQNKRGCKTSKTHKSLVCG